MKLNYKKAWVLVEQGKVSHYYSLLMVFKTKKNAIAERDYRNRVLGHKMQVKQCIMTIEG